MSRDLTRLCAKAASAAVFVAGIVAMASASREDAPGLFRDITRSSGIDFRVGSDMRRLKMIPTVMGGCAFGDYDGDGLADLYVTNSVPHWGREREELRAALPEPRRRTVRTCGAGRHHACGLGMGAFWVDLDGDGASTFT